MSYIALYRKLRPQIFEEIFGQEHIITTLKNQIINNRVAHAYLFCGTRGTGKTTTAKVFAKTINCINNLEGNSCGKCKNCIDILEQKSMNVIEIDAASNSGVDNIRDIREEVKYPPTEGKYKVYIIDEVHMLSIPAFNALLKTLEEPPKHVIFILATTDPQKIPPTILSRCQRFDFKRITTKIMVAEIKKYMVKENINITEEALEYIAFLSDGSVRDALSILDQCIAFYYNEEITLKKIQETVGAVDNTVFFNLTDYLVDSNSEKALDIIKEIIINGRDINQFVLELITHFRNLLISKSIKEQESTALNLSKENISQLIKQGENIETDILINYINIFSNVQNEIKYSFNPRIILEVTCIKICNRENKNSYEELLNRIKNLEDLIKNKNLEEKINIPINNKIIKKEKAVPNDFQRVISDFRNFTREFSYLPKSMLELCFAGYLEDGLLYIVTNNLGAIDYLKNQENIILKKLEGKYNKEFILKFIKEEEYNFRHENLYGVKDNQKIQLNPLEDLRKNINFPIDEF